MISNVEIGVGGRFWIKRAVEENASAVILSGHSVIYHSLPLVFGDRHTRTRTKTNLAYRDDPSRSALCSIFLDDLAQICQVRILASLISLDLIRRSRMASSSTVEIFPLARTIALDIPYFFANSRASRVSLMDVPVISIRSTPASRARVTTRSRSEGCRALPWYSPRYIESVRLTAISAPVNIGSIN
jgi:hypothetical protein